MIWNPIYNQQNQALERIQRSFIRSATYILDGTYPARDTPHVALIQSFDLQPLHQRRSIYAVLLLFKILNCYIDCPFLLCKVPFLVPRLSSRDNNTFYIRTPKSNSLVKSPLHFMLSSYNILESHIDLFFNNISDIKKCVSCFT